MRHRGRRRRTRAPGRRRPTPGAAVAAHPRRAHHDRHPVRPGDRSSSRRTSPSPGSSGPSAKGRFSLVLLYLAARRADRRLGDGQRARGRVAGATRRPPGAASPTPSSGRSSSAGSASCSPAGLYGLPTDDPPDGPLAVLIPNLSAPAVPVRGAGHPGRAVLRDRAVRAARARADPRLQPDPGRSAAASCWSSSSAPRRSPGSASTWRSS